MFIMALTDENGGNGMIMPVAPLYGGGGNNNGGLFGNGDSWLGILFLIALLNGGWGNGFGGGFGGGMGMMMGGMYDFPWLMTGQQGINTNTNNGFQNALLNDNITSIRDGIGNLSTQLCNCCGDMQMSMANGFGGVNLGIANSTAAIQNSLCNGFNGVNTAVNTAQNAIAAQMYNNEIANLNRSFAEQTANTQGFNGLQAQLAQCCCDNRAATADLKYTVATENCADRTQAMQNTRDIIDAQNRGTQAILDKLCALELDGVKSQLAQAQRENVGLQNAVNMAAFRESQANQNALFAQGMTAEVDALYNRLKNCPVNTVPVAGNTPLFSCNPSFNNSGCGCGSF